MCQLMHNDGEKISQRHNKMDGSIQFLKHCKKYLDCLRSCLLVLFQFFSHCSVFADVTAPPAHWISCGLPFAEQATWNPKFCIVTDSQLLLLDKGKVRMLMC